jgi:hypothetical protein
MTKWDKLTDEDKAKLREVTAEQKKQISGLTSSNGWRSSLLMNVNRCLLLAVSAHSVRVLIGVPLQLLWRRK